MLLELLSHQNFADMRLGHDPRFKFLVSRAVYKGILRYVSSQYDLPYVVQPLPVEAFAAEFAAAGEVALSWSPAMDPLEATAAPTGYVVYSAWTTAVSTTAAMSTNPPDRPAGTGAHVQLPGHRRQRGRRELPSETLAACRVPDEKGLLADRQQVRPREPPQSERNDSLAGFRMDLDGGVADRQDIAFIGAQRVFDLAQARCNVGQRRPRGLRVRLGETDVIGGNTFDYPALHGRSVAAAGYSFCSASARAVGGARCRSKAYPAVDLILGKQRTTPLGRGVRGGLPDLSAGVAGRPAALSGRRRRAFCIGKLRGGRPLGRRDPGGARVRQEVLRIDSDGDIPRTADGCGL